MPERFSKTIGGYKVIVEAWPQAGWNLSWDGIAFCPVKDCERVDAFHVISRKTPARAAGDAFDLLKKHYARKHK